MGRTGCWAETTAATQKESSSSILNQNNSTNIKEEQQHAYGTAYGYLRSRRMSACRTAPYNAISIRMNIP
eukprot:6214607-Pleurochrysis_carterae.AAC.1